MSQLVLNVGSNANDGTGDTLRDAMIKVNTNFTEVYGSAGFDLTTIQVTGNEIRATRTNDDIVFKPAGAGAVEFPALRINGNNIEGTRSNEDINLKPSGTGNVVFGAIQIKGTTLSSTDSSTININEGLIVDGSMTVSGSTTFQGAISAGTGSTVGNLTLANGSITDSSGAISFGNENLTTTGTMTAASGSTFGNLTLADGSITDSSGAISFGNENLSTTGTMTAGSGSTIGNLTLADGSITDSSGAISFGNENLTTTGTLTTGTLTMAGGSITDSSGAISFGNENLSTTGTLTVSGLSTLGSLTVTGAMTFTSGGVTVDNLSFNDNTISSSSNADIRLTPGGTGSVIVNSLTIDDNINITDNHIKATASNSDLILSPSGTGSVVIAKADINSGAIDGTVIGGSTAAAGTFTTLTVTQALTLGQITIDDNQVKTNSSNANLELSGNGSGGVTISGFTFPTTDGSSGQFIKTDGAGTLSFATAGATLDHSDLSDATTTVASSATTTLNTFNKTVYRSAKYFISIKDSTNSRFEIVEANVTHDGSDAYVSTFGSTTNYTGGLCVFTADISGNDVRLRVTNISDASTVFKFQRIAVDL
jgi:hypothetical protein